MLTLNQAEALLLSFIVRVLLVQRHIIVLYSTTHCYLILITTWHVKRTLMFRFSSTHLLV